MPPALSFILNIPWTIFGILCGMLSVPIRTSIKDQPRCFVIYVRGFWWVSWIPGYKGLRAMTVGHTVLLGRQLLAHDLEHELVHVEQAIREPFIHPFLYILESFRYGYKDNKYEREAYRRAGNTYIDT